MDTKSCAKTKANLRGCWGTGTYSMPQSCIVSMLIHPDCKTGKNGKWNETIKPLVPVQYVQHFSKCFTWWTVSKEGTYKYGKYAPGVDVFHYSCICWTRCYRPSLKTLRCETCELVHLHTACLMGAVSSARQRHNRGSKPFSLWICRRDKTSVRLMSA